MSTIDSSRNTINGIVLTDQSTTPETPPSGKHRLYTSASGLHIIDSSGSTIGPITMGQGARVYSGSVALSNNTYTFLNFNSELFDTDNIHSTISNTGSLVATTAGKYLISGCVEFAFHNTGIRLLGFFLNNTTIIAEQSVMAITVTDATTRISLSTIYSLAKNDFLELYALQSSGGSLNLITTDFPPSFMMQRIG